MMAPQRFQVKDVAHSVLWYHRDHYAGHPNRGGIWNLGNGEIAVAHVNAHRPYRGREDTFHDYMHTARILLQRSFDSGETWPQDQETVIWNRGASIEEHREWLFGDPSDRQELDMTQPGAIFHFGQVAAGYDLEQEVQSTGKTAKAPSLVHFGLRSVDGGRTWENRPTVIAPPSHRDGNIVANFPMVQFENGVFAKAVTVGGGQLPDGEVCMHVTDNHGLTWDYMQTIAADPLGISGCTYPSLLRLPNGRLLAIMHRLNIGSNGNIGNWPCLCASDDGGMSWSQPRAMIRPDQSPWPAHRKPLQFDRPRTITSNAVPVPAYTPQAPGAPMYRAPYPVLLRDGRILVILGRRKAPPGISCILSEDGGQTWLPEVVLRADGAEGDGGYPVATELDDGRIFTAYYFCTEPELPFGGPRHIAGTHFRID